MNILGEYWLPATSSQLWAALSSLDILQRCLDRGASLRRTSPGEYLVEFAVAQGPLEGVLESSAKLTDITLPRGVELAGEARGALIGSFTWHAAITTETDSSGCMLKYSLDTEATGRPDEMSLAQIEKAIRAGIDRFLGALSHEILSLAGSLQAGPDEAGAAVPTQNPGITESAQTDSPKRARAMRLWPWIAVLILVGLRLLAYFQSG